MPDPDPKSWGVVCTADEPPALLCAFALYHLDLGAREVHLFLDAPRPGVRALLETIDGVIVYEGAEVSRKPAIEKRQLDNAFVAYARTGVAWLAHVDSDEFIAPAPGETIGAILADLPDTVDYLTMPMRERAYAGAAPGWSIFAGGLIAPYEIGVNLPAPTQALERRAMYAGRGLLAHASGKSFARTGRPILIGIHRPRPRKDHPRKDRGRMALVGNTTKRAVLMHFDGLTPFHWAAKLWRMARFMPAPILEIQAPGRQALIRQARAALPGIAPILEIAADVRHLGPDSIAALRAASVWSDQRTDPAAPAVASGLLPPEAFTIDEFDDALTAMFPQLAEFREGAIAERRSA